MARTPRPTSPMLTARPRPSPSRAAKMLPTLCWARCAKSLAEMIASDLGKSHKDDRIQSV
eukprot:8190246-Pyramimonas_sp.AAC.1